MRWYIENWLTDEVIRVFRSYDELEIWLHENANSFSDGYYLDDGTKLNIYSD